MDLGQQKEQYSIAFVRAIAAVAGYTVYRPEVDDDSVDIGFAARGLADTPRAPRIEAQLKCTARTQFLDGMVRFPLKRKNYDDLRGDVLVPRVLVVVSVPDAAEDWLAEEPERLALAGAARWISLAGARATRNTGTITVSLPEEQRFGVAALRDLMRRVGRREAL